MNILRTALILIAISAVALFIGPQTVKAFGACVPWQACSSDGDCSQGVCLNNVCNCGADIESVPICTDRCPDRGLCYNGQCGGNTVQITDCRGIDAGDKNGVISYCDQPACVANAGQACSASNSCGMTNGGTVNCDGTCSASPPSNALCLGAQPVGSHDWADCSSSGGWAFDPDYTGAVSVHIYRDGPAGLGGTLVAAVNTGDSRPDVDAWAQGAGYSPPNRTSSGWHWMIPSTLKDGIAHTLYAYAINVNSGGTPSGPNPQLWSTPKTITCTEPPAGTLTSATCSTATGSAIDPQGTPVTIRIYNGLVGAGGTLIGSGTANPNFSVPITPPQDGAPHTLYAYAQDIPGGTWYQLTGSAQVTCNPTVPPTATITQITRPNYCQSGPEGIATWQYTSTTGLAQKQWELQAANNPGFLPPLYDSGIKVGSTTTATTGQGILSFGRTYWMRVKVWDTANNVSAWSPSASFTTPAGPYPLASFTMSPTSPIAKQPTTFTDTSDYNTGIPTLRQWDFGDGTTTTDTPGSAETTHTYATTGSGTTVILHVSSTNSGADVCTATKTFNVSKPIPTYKEVLP